MLYLLCTKIHTCAVTLHAVNKKWDYRNEKARLVHLGVFHSGTFEAASQKHRLSLSPYFGRWVRSLFLFWQVFLFTCWVWGLNGISIMAWAVQSEFVLLSAWPGPWVFCGGSQYSKLSCIRDFLVNSRLCLLFGSSPVLTREEKGALLRASIKCDLSGQTVINDPWRISFPFWMEG